MIISNEKTLPEKKKCGLCGSTNKKIIKTSCCNNWICDDESDYVIFSYARNSCYRNHNRYTLCSYHFIEEHDGDWLDCKKCKDSFDLPDYVDMGTNEHNFKVLKNPEKITVTCVNCGFTANTVSAFAYQTPKGHYCPRKECQEAVFADRQ